MTEGKNHLDISPLRDIQAIASRLKLPTLAVGANARLLVLDLPLRIEPHRTSADWDIGIEVQQWEHFAQLKQEAVHSGLFSVSPDEHRLIHRPTGMPVDLIPFGGVELNGVIRWPQSQNEMTVLGFEEAMKYCFEQELGGGVRIKIPTLPLLIVLKLFAFHDRGAHTNKDLTDVLHVVRNYPLRGREADRFGEPYISSLGEDASDDEVAALFLGHDIARVCKPATIKQLESIVAVLVDPYGTSVTSVLTRTYDDDSEKRERERIGKIFSRLSQGLSIQIDQ